MPKKADDNLYGYDRKTDTVRVRRHDLGRRLLVFRDLTEQAARGSWSHMEDYDISFERLADAVEAASREFSGRDWRGPDWRLRCNLSEAYRWPAAAPYNGEAVKAVRVKDEAFGTDRGSHYVAEDWSERPETLCGFGFVPEEGTPVTGEPSCPECRRELALVEHLRDSAAETAP